MGTEVKSPGTAVIVSPRALTKLLETEAAVKRIKPMLRGVEYTQIVGEAYLAAEKNPDILKCTQASIVAAIARACSWGLVIGETAHLVPFGKTLTAVQDYKGKIELIVAAGGAKSVNAQVVYEKEPFSYRQGTDPMIDHTPARKNTDRGVLMGAYAVADHGSNRIPSIVWMTIEDIDDIRKNKSKQWKSGACPPWYAKKTVVHQLAKLLPKNPKLAKMLRTLDEDDEPEEVQPRNTATATVSQEDGTRDEGCICAAGEVDPNCPVHGDFAGTLGD